MKIVVMMKIIFFVILSYLFFFIFVNLELDIEIKYLVYLD